MHFLFLFILGLSAVTLRPYTGKNIVIENVGFEPVIIDVKGSGKGDIDCYLYGPDKKYVTSDTSPDNFCHVRTANNHAGEYHLVIFNEGEVTDQYTITAH